MLRVACCKVPKSPIGLELRLMFVGVVDLCRSSRSDLQATSKSNRNEVNFIEENSPSGTLDSRMLHHTFDNKLAHKLPLSRTLCESLGRQPGALSRSVLTMQGRAICFASTLRGTYLQILRYIIAKHYEVVS